MMIECCKCKTPKDESNFYRNKKRGDYLIKKCKDCFRDYQLKWEKKILADEQLSKIYKKRRNRNVRLRRLKKKNIANAA